MVEFSPPDNIDYRRGVDKLPGDYADLHEKRAEAERVLWTCLTTYDNPALLWTGGKDSTLALHFLRQVASDLNAPLPPAVFIDHFHHFPEVRSFIERWSAEWGISVVTAQNTGVEQLIVEYDIGPGDDIPVDELDEENQRHVRELLGREDETIPFKLNTEVGNHLLKTVALNQTIEEHGFDAVIAGVRWDEQPARRKETFFSSRHDDSLYPPHDRAHPILPFTEADVWDVTWQELVPITAPIFEGEDPPRSVEELPEGVVASDIPILPPYFDGYRSVGGAADTEPTGDEPAWVQSREGGGERDGRAQDKEEMMEKLRSLGYM